MTADREDLMSDETRLNELLDRWEELQARGEAATLEDLCLHDLGLVDELRRRIAALRGIDAILRGGMAATGDSEAGRNAAGAPPAPTLLPAVSPYSTLQFHAQGGLGEVFRARDEHLRRDVAVKLIRTSRAGSAEGRLRFEREAEITGRLEHPGIAPVHAAGRSDDGRPYYAMRFIDGETLGDAIRRHHAADPPIRDSGERTIAFRGLLNRFVQVCTTIDYAHGQGVLHRDVKPSNVMLGPYGETLVVDWGLAKPYGEGDQEHDEAAPAEPTSPHLTAAGSALGTPAFMAPEQLDLGAGHLGPATDVYSLGATLYSLLTGRAPFEGEDLASVQDRVRRGDFRRPREVNREVPRPLEAVCLKAMALDPHDRYASPRMLADDVERWLADEPVSAWAEPWSLRLIRRARRHRAWVASGVIALAAVSLISVIATVRIEDALQKERAARVREAEQRRAAQLYTTRVIVNRGLAFCQAGEVARGILWLSRGLEVMPLESEDTLGRAIRANLAGWSHELRSLKAICAHPAERRHIFSATFSPDGRTIFSGSEDGTARLWSSEDGTPLGRLLRHPGPVEHVTLGPHGRIALTASGSRAHLWDLTTGHPLRDPVAHASKVIAIAFSLDGKEILTTTADGKVHVVSLSADNNPRTIHLTNVTNLTAARFAPDAKRLLTGEPGYQARVWAVPTGRQLGAFLEHRSAIRALAFSPDGRKCVSGDEQGISRIWTADGGRPIGMPLNHRSHVWCAAFSPDGRTVITGSDDRTVQFWDASTGQSSEAPLELRAIIQSVAFSPDGATFLAAGQYGQIWHWGISGSQRAVSALGHPGKWVTSVAFSHDGKAALTAGGNPLGIRGLGFPPPGFSRLWDVASGRPRGDPILFDQTVISAALSPDGSRLLAGCGALYTKAGGAYLYSLTPDVPEVIRLDHDNTQVWAVAFSPDGRMVATGSFNNFSTSHIGDARLWDAATGRLHKVLRHPGGGVVAIAFSPDGRSVVTGGNDHTARFWETASGEPTGPVLTHRDVVLGAAFSPDGRSVITCSIDFTARIWDRATGAIVGMPFQHNGWIRSVSFSPDGKTVLTAGGLDDTARLWDVATGLPVGPPVRHGDWVLSAAFAPDGRSILTGSKDTTARVRRISAPVEGAPETLSLWARVTTGMTVEQDDVFRPLEIQEWQRSSQLYRESARRTVTGGP